MIIGMKTLAARFSILLMALSSLLLLSAFLLFAALPVSADGGAPNLAYVAGAGHGVSVIDIAQKAMTGNFTVGGDPQMLYLSIDGRFLYVTQPSLGQMLLLSAKTGQTICTARVPGQPSVLSYDPATNTLFVAANNVSGISQIDASTCKVLRTLSTSSPVNAVAVANTASSTNSGDQLWVAESTMLAVFDTSSHKLLATVPMQGGPQHLVLPSGTNIYVSTRSGVIDAVDISSYHVTKVITGGMFGTMDYDAVTGEIYAPDIQRQQLDVLTPVSAGVTTSTEPAHVYHLPAAPQAAAITSDGQLGFVALSNGDVVMIDIPGQQIVKTIHVGGTPRFIITGLYPPDVATTPQQAALASVITTVIGIALILVAIIVPGWFIVRSRSRLRKNP